MPVFGKYSSYYNLLYKDKDYAGEVEYVHNLIRKHYPEANDILDLGCGTGGHDFLLTEKGYHVTGIDRSEEMLAVANSQLSSLIPNPSSLSFTQGDIRNIRLNKNFDAVISLFHVMSYQTSNEDLRAAFETAKAHLKPGGVFIFDCWYGPAVLTERPAMRVKRLEDDATSVLRIAEPAVFPNDNVVDVNYTILITDKKSGVTEELREIHRMRYLFKPETEMMLSDAGFKPLVCEEWMTGKEPGSATWSVGWVAGKKDE